MKTDKYTKVVLTLIVICTNMAIAEDDFLFFVDDYYPEEQKKIAREIELVLKTHIKAFKSRDIDLLVSTHNPLIKERTKNLWVDMFKRYKHIDTDFIAAAWLGKDKFFSYVRVGLKAKTEPPGTLEYQVWAFTKDKGKWTIIGQCTVFGFPLDMKEPK